MSFPFPVFISWIKTSTTVGEAISGEDALDGAHGGQWSYSLLIEEFADGFCSARQTPIVEMEPLHDNDFFDFYTAEECVGHRHF